MNKRRIITAVTMCVLLILTCVVVGFTLDNKTAYAEIVGDVSDGSSAMTGENEPEAYEKAVWEIYLEEKLVPSVILVLTAIGSIYIAIAPILSRIRNASDKFKTATEDVNTATHKTIENEKKVANLESRLDKIEKATTNTEQILRLGFCNINELVTKGYATEIAKVGKKDEDS